MHLKIGKRKILYCYYCLCKNYKFFFYLSIVFWKIKQVVLTAECQEQSDDGEQKAE